jgi:hypothetical protein
MRAPLVPTTGGAAVPMVVTALAMVVWSPQHTGAAETCGVVFIKQDTLMAAVLEEMSASKIGRACIMLLRAALAYVQAGRSVAQQLLLAQLLR